jgi:hypothetical protein
MCVMQSAVKEFCMQRMRCANPYWITDRAVSLRRSMMCDNARELQ